ncbi:macrolide-efflux protein [[Clostridium] sordellii]|uniref:MFS transporter n=1 Tax=Paraclostridium sordellii TaxID=1505 RepID=UPI0005DE6BEB|nr:MFS transporter [Paeniclostridium sordellii]MDU2686889.1 MFS transporter [Paeniclostridium sordellii]MVO72531.1 MFS transporter [Paeniclostridium sordellii]CEN31165.1 macrolide-efflux protein [[Clostridium] sordellii] [Paeniclostridium sordellii]
MNTKIKLFNKNFTLLVIGQIISLFGNSILRFALPLYLLDITKSATLFGAVSACSLIPMVTVTPFGGIIADRVNKRNIMVALDFLTAILILAFLFSIGKFNLVFMLIITLMTLYGIQGAYQPTVQASIPLLVDRENLLPGNAVINQVSSLAGLLGPIIGGILYGFYGLIPILIASIICFFISAVMEIFIKISYKKRQTTFSAFAIVKEDFKTSLTFIFKNRPVIFKTIFIISCFNLVLSSLIMIGIPVIITQILNMSSQAYGVTQGLLAFGGLFGGIMTGVLVKKIKIYHSHIILLIAILGLVPIGFVIMFNVTPMTSYVVITACCFLIMAVSTLFSIQILTFIQSETPSHLTGKVISFCLAMTMCSQPIGQIIYGYLFEVFKDDTYIIIFMAVLISSLIAFMSKKIFSNLKETKVYPEVCNDRE